VKPDLDLDIKFVGPDDREINALLEKSFSDEGLVVRRGKGFTFLESAEPPIHVIVNLNMTQVVEVLTLGTLGTLAATIGGAMAKEFGKDVYVACKRVLLSLATAITKAYRQIKGSAQRETFYSIIVKAEGRPSAKYNVPGSDHEMALVKIVDDYLTDHFGRGELFWNYGRWQTSDEYDALTEELMRPSDALAVPNVEFLKAVEQLIEIFGNAPVFKGLGNNRDIMIDVPAEVSREARQQAIEALRSAMPDSTIGLAANRSEIYVSEALAIQ
jgi:hypothetical protein